MSRNSEKAQSLLNRYHAQQYGLPQTRPKSTKFVKDLKEAERYRGLCVQEISSKVTRINDILVTESQIRDLNDELNKLMKEKRAWEYKIKELGGPDYLQFKQKSSSDNGLVVRGYKYFGRAKELPDVVKLVEMTKQELTKAREMKKGMKNDEALMNNINSVIFTPEYYGLYDDDDEIDEDDTSIASQEDIIHQVRSILGNDALPADLVTDSEVSRMNKGYTGVDKSGRLARFEKRKTRNIQRGLSEKEDEEPVVKFDELSDQELTLQQLEKFVVQKRKETLLKKLQSTS